jgi:hypothetical protein
MHPRTAATLAELEKAEWFSRVGIDDTEGSVIVLSSWQQAVEICGSTETKNLWLEAANQYHMRVLERSKERYRQWNGIANELRPIVNGLVGRKIEAVARENLLPKVFQDHVRWEMIFLLMESEFADVYPPGFFASHAYWYVAGHFPCGWQGNFPKEGRLIVY